MREPHMGEDVGCGLLARGQNAPATGMASICNLKAYRCGSCPCEWNEFTKSWLQNHAGIMGIIL